MPIEIKFTEETVWIFGDDTKCQCYKDNSNRYWYQFQDKVNKKMKGPFNTQNTCYQAAFKYYMIEWVPF